MRRGRPFPSERGSEQHLTGPGPEVPCLKMELHRLNQQRTRYPNENVKVGGGTIDLPSQHERALTLLTRSDGPESK
jgi:hypothetical protein